MASITQITANRINAQSSAGPRSEEGKSVSRRNAARHGILSGKLLLDDEDRDAFDDLLIDLNETLRPVGAVEFGLVERIAVTLWRQRRLVGAETASLALSRSRQRLASQVGSELDPHRISRVDPDDLEPFDEVQEKWCREIVDECEALDEDLNPALLPNAVPHIFRQLTEDADDEGLTVEAYLGARDDGLSGYVGELAGWCRKQLKASEERPKILAVAEHVRGQRLVPRPEMLELLSRYQTTLDNQLCKILKALRETQEWRFKTLQDQAVLVETAE